MKNVVIVFAVFLGFSAFGQSSLLSEINLNTKRTEITQGVFQYPNPNNISCVYGNMPKRNNQITLIKTRGYITICKIRSYNYNSTITRTGAVYNQEFIRNLPIR